MNLTRCRVPTIPFHQRKGLRTNNLSGPAFFFLALLLAIWIGSQIGASGLIQVTRFTPVVITAAVGLAILLRPYLGVVFLFIALLLKDMLPSMPFLSSALQLIGAAALGAFFFHVSKSRRIWQRRPQPQYVIGAGFIVWLFASHPQAAVLLGDRNWLLTYAQLWVLMWLTGRLMSETTHQRVLIGAFVVTVLLPAAVAVQSGHIGQSINASYRAVGTMTGANEAARRFVVGIVLSAYLVETAVTKKAKLAGYCGLGLSFAGVAFTMSRTGFVLAFVAVLLMIVFRGRSKVFTVRLSTAGVIVSVAFLLVPGQYWELIGARLLSSIVHGRDTMAVRYGLWHAGLRMWVEHPLTGVGVGQFSINLPAYGSDLLNMRHMGGPHSIYVGLLAETGIVGLALFLGLAVSAVVTLWKTMSNMNTKIAVLARTWLIVLIVLLLGGATKHDQYDKALWLVFGMSVALSSVDHRTRIKDSYPLVPERAAAVRQIQAWFRR